VTTINTSYKNAGVTGVPAFEAMDTFVDSNLVAGAEPRISSPNRILLGDSLTLAQFSVVGLNAAGKLVLATYDAVVANAVKPVGVLLAAAASGAANSTIYGEVTLTGNFNAGSDDAGTDSPLVWDATYNTLAKKTQGPLVVGNPNLVFRSRLGGNVAGQAA
jgi:hypothetical protein